MKRAVRNVLSTELSKPPEMSNADALEMVGEFTRVAASGGDDWLVRRGVYDFLRKHASSERSMRIMTAFMADDATDVEIGEEFEISKERVRQIRARTLLKMRRRESIYQASWMRDLYFLKDAEPAREEILRYDWPLYDDNYEPPPTEEDRLRNEISRLNGEIRLLEKNIDTQRHLLSEAVELARLIKERGEADIENMRKALNREANKRRRLDEENRKLRSFRGKIRFPGEGPKHDPDCEDLFGG